jgi:hypothetical protein
MRLFPFFRFTLATRQSGSYSPDINKEKGGRPKPVTPQLSPRQQALFFPLCARFSVFEAMHSDANPSQAFCAMPPSGFPKSFPVKKADKAHNYHQRREKT